jgi:hypothetical protein
MLVCMLPDASLAASPVAFGPALHYPLAGTGVGGRVIVGDFNGDRFMDLAATPSPQGPEAYPNVDGVNVLFGDGQGGFPQATTFHAGEVVSGIASADLNHDNRLDLVTTEAFGDRAVPVGICASRFSMAPVFLGLAPNNFTFQQCLGAADHPGAVAAGDFDGDGIADLVIVNSTRYSSDAASRDAYFLKGLGNGAFLPGVAFLADHADDIVVADFNGDLKLDFAIASTAFTEIYLGAGDGTFTRFGSGIPGMAQRLAAGDLDGDGIVDLASVGSNPVDPGDDLVRIAFGNGDGSFRAGYTLATGEHPVGVALADLDNDRHLDVIVANHLSNDISIFLADGQGGFLTEQRTPAGNGPMALAAADFNGDGVPDVAVTNSNPLADGSLGDGGMTLLINATPAASPVTVPLSPVATAILMLVLAALGGAWAERRSSASRPGCSARGWH